MKNNIKLFAILLVSTVSMARVGALFGQINILQYPWFQWLEVLALVSFAIIEVLFIEKAGRTLATLAYSRKRWKGPDRFIFWFVAAGMIFIGSWLPIVGGVAWVLLTGLPWWNLAWTIPTLAIVPVAMGLHGMSNIIIPDEVKISKTKEDDLIIDIVNRNGDSPLQIADRHNITLEQYTSVENKIHEQLN